MANNQVSFQDRVQNLTTMCDEGGYDLTIRWIASDRMWYADIEETHNGPQVEEFESDTLEVLVDALEAWLDQN